MPKQELNNFEDVFHIFEASQNAKGVSETTLNNYKYNLKNISQYLDVKKPFDDVTKRDIEQKNCMNIERKERRGKRKRNN